jgi:hypothetical protein
MLPAQVLIPRKTSMDCELHISFLRDMLRAGAAYRIESVEASL